MGRGLTDGRGWPRLGGCAAGRRGRGGRGTARGGPGGWLSHLGICGVGASEGKQRDAHSRHHPHRDSRGGDRHPGICPDAVPAHPPDRLREHCQPCRFRAPDYLSAVDHRILVRGGAKAQDLLPQFRRERGQRQQTGKSRRAQRAPPVIGAGLALLDVPDDEVARLLGQLSIPVGQQFPYHRAGLPPGKRGAQRTERLL